MGVWGDEEIIVDLTAGSVAVRGPIEFVMQIDWPRVEAVALLLAQALGPVDALKVALWREYRGWRRRSRWSAQGCETSRTGEGAVSAPPPPTPSLREVSGRRPVGTRSC